MIGLSEYRTYIPEDEVFFQAEDWYCTTRLVGEILELRYNGIGRYQNAPTRKETIRLEDVYAIFEEDENIIIETREGKRELRKAYSAEEMKGLKKVEEKPTLSLTELLEL